MIQFLQFFFLSAIFSSCYGYPPALPKDLQACLDTCFVINNHTGSFHSRTVRNAIVDTDSIANAILENLGLIHARAAEIVENICVSEQTSSCFEKCQERNPDERLRKLLDTLQEINNVACSGVNGTIAALNCLDKIKIQNEDDLVHICEQGNEDFAQKRKNFVEFVHQNQDGLIVLPGKELCELADSVQLCFEKYGEICGQVSLKIHNLLSDYSIFLLEMHAEAQADRCADIILPPIAGNF